MALELGARGAASSVCAISPIGFAAGRERGYAERTLVTIRRLAEAFEPHAPAVYGGPVRRMLAMSLVVSRPWRVPAEDAVHMNRATATAPAFAATLPEVGALAAGDALLPDDDRVGAARPPADHLAPGAARRAPAPGRPPRPAAGCGHVPMWDDPEQVARVLLDASAGA